MNIGLILAYLRPDATPNVDYFASGDSFTWVGAGVAPTAQEVADAEPAAVAHWQAVAAAKTAADADLADMRAQFAVDLGKLSAIVTAPSFTNAQRDAALQDLARVGRRLLKGVKATVL